MDESAHNYPTEALPPGRRLKKLLTSGDWMARVVIESLLIVFSILAALGVNEWQNTKQNNELATQALVAFQREIQQNQGRLAGVAPVHLGLREVLIRMNDAGAFRTADQFYNSVGVEQLRPPFVTSTVWETSLTTGAIPHIDFDLVNALSLTYSLQQRLSEFSRTSMPTLARGASVPPEQMQTAVREAVLYLTDLSRSEAELLTTYEEVLRILGEVLPADSAGAQSAADDSANAPD